MYRYIIKYTFFYIVDTIYKIIIKKNIIYKYCKSLYIFLFQWMADCFISTVRSPKTENVNVCNIFSIIKAT